MHSFSKNTKVAIKQCSEIILARELLLQHYPEFPKFYEQFLKKTIESISISIFLFKKTSERISISIFLFDQDKLQFSCPRLQVLLTEFPSQKFHFSDWWIQQLLTPTKDQFPLHGADIALHWALGTASDYRWKFSSFCKTFTIEETCVTGSLEAFTLGRSIKVVFLIKL